MNDDPKTLSDGEKKLMQSFGSPVSGPDVTANPVSCADSGEINNLRAERLRRGDDRGAPRILVCINNRLDPRRPSCAARGSEALAAMLTELAREAGLADAVEQVRCLGHCETGPSARIAPSGDFLDHARETDLPGLIAALAEIRARAAE